jgi:pimeloyl-ACP methyl ester carboxylesterase
MVEKVKWSDGHEHWIKKGDVDLFLWNKEARTSCRGVILFVHGSSMASQPTFDLHVPGRAYSSAMDWFRDKGFDTWTLDNEGYGRSDKKRLINFDIQNGVDDLVGAVQYILSKTDFKRIHLYGISSGALKAAMFAQQNPELVDKLIIDAFVWTGQGSPTLASRKEKLKDYISHFRRPIDEKFVKSIFDRDHPGTADSVTVDAFAKAILTLDDSVPTGTYVDMCTKLPMVDPEKITSAVLLLRGEYDGIATMSDLLEFFARLPNMNKQFSVMRGISHASFQQKNYLMVYEIIHSFLTMTQPIYLGD